MSIVRFNIEDYLKEHLKELDSIAFKHNNIYYGGVLEYAYLVEEKPNEYEIIWSSYKNNKQGKLIVEKNK